jgi:hypothetical protein
VSTAIGPVDGGSQGVSEQPAVNNNSTEQVVENIFVETGLKLSLFAHFLLLLDL